MLVDNIAFAVICYNWTRNPFPDKVAILLRERNVKTAFH